MIEVPNILENLSKAINLKRQIILDLLKYMVENIIIMLIIQVNKPSQSPS